MSHPTVMGPHWERVVEVSPPGLPQAAESGVTVAWLWGEGPWGSLTYPQSNSRWPNPPDLGRRVLVVAKGRRFFWPTYRLTFYTKIIRETRNQIGVA